MADERHQPPHRDNATCESCGAAIVWAVTAAGRRMPLDAKSEKRAVFHDTGAPGENQRVAMVDTYVPHFATCPHSRQWSGKTRQEVRSA